MRDKMLNAMTENLQETTPPKDDSARISQLEAKLIQAEKMCALGQLIAGITHELNNSLGTILGLAQIVSRKPESAAPLEMPIKYIERQALRCNNLVQDLLAFSRVDNSDPVPVELNKLIESTISLVHAKARMNSIKIKVDFSPDISCIFGNHNQIQQIVIHLVNNAIDAMPKGGVLGISTTILKEPHLPWVCLKISDTGSGIPKEIQSKIFEPFFTTKPAGKGSGLGLSLVVELVQKHSGTIEVQSHPGLTEFCVKFPVDF